MQSISFLKSKTTDITALSILIAIAGLSHFYRIQSVPPGLGVDEAAAGLDALETLRSGPHLYYPLQGGGGSLWVYLTAVFFMFMGPDPLAMRALGALFGVGGVVMTYLLGRELLLPIWGANRAQWGAALAAAWMGISVWYLSDSRVAWPPATIPLIVSSSFFFTWRGINTSRRWYFVIGGLFLGLTWYTYLAARFAPLILLVFLGLDLLVVRHRGGGQPIWREHRPHLLWLFVTALVVMLPIIVYYLLNPSDLVARSSEVSFLNPVISQGSAANAVTRGLGITMAGFGFTLTGWAAPSFVLLFDRLTTACFLVGLVVALTRFRQRYYLFLVVWWLMSLIPSLLAVGSFFHLLRRTVVAQPPVFFLASLCVVSAALTIERFLHLDALTSGLVLGSLSLTILVWVGVHSYSTFFVTWEKDATIQSLFNAPSVELAQTMKERSSEKGLYLLLSDSTSTSFPSERYVIEFLYNDPTSFLYLYDDEETLLSEMAPVLADKESVDVIRWTEGKQKGADPKGYVDYLLNRWGDLVGTETFANYTIATYQRTLPGSEFPSIALQATDVTFGEQLRLVGVAYGPAGQSAPWSPVPASGVMWIELVWESITDTGRDFEVALVVQDGSGHFVGQDDQLLLDNKRHLGTRHWDIGQVEHSYHLLSIMPAIPPGSYQLQAIVYDPVDGRRLWPSLPQVGGDLAVPLGEVMVKPASITTPLATIDIPLSTNRSVASGLRLLGSEQLPEQALNPGDRLPITLYWEAENALTRDYEASLWLVRSGEESRTLVGPKPIGGATYPTGHWRAGEVMRQWLDAYVPAAVQGGGYQAGLQILDISTQQSISEVSLGEISVAARERQFSAPAIEHSVDVALGDQVRLLGFGLTFLPDDRSVQLTLFWQALREMNTSYKVFVHLVDETGHVWTQSDAVPVGGQAPTTGWLPGEVLTDHYNLSLPEDRPSGTYTLLAGLYDPQTGHRLSVGGASADAVRLIQVEVP